MALNVQLSSRSVLRVLSAGISVLALGHVAMMVMMFGLGHHRMLGVRRLLDLNEEQNPGSLFSTLLLLSSAALLTLLAWESHRADKAERKNWIYWAGLALVFAFMGIDEFASIHELFTPKDHGSGVFFFAWIIPYLAAALAISLLYLRFLWRLPRGVAIRLIAAGAIYIAGAAGVEMLEGVLVQANGGNYFTVPLETAYLIEETMEMFGVAFFITGLLRYFEERYGVLRFTLSIDRPKPAPAAKPRRRRAVA